MRPPTHATSTPSTGGIDFSVPVAELRKGQKSVLDAVLFEEVYKAHGTRYQQSLSSVLGERRIYWATLLIMLLKRKVGEHDGEKPSVNMSTRLLLYFKLETKLPDQGGQTLLNLTKLGRNGASFCQNVIFVSGWTPIYLMKVFWIYKH